MTKTFKTLFVGLVFLYLYAPIAVLVVNSFNKSKYGHRWSGFSWTWYEKLLNNDTLITAFTNSLTIAVLSATAASVIGTLMALAIYRYRFRFKQTASGALFVVITVYAQLKGFDAHLIEAAQDLGASERAVFWHIILPLLVPSVAASWLLSFTLSLDDVIISSFVTGPQYEVLPIRVFSMVKVGVSPEVNVLAALLLLISMVCLAVFAWFMKRKPKL